MEWAKKRPLFGGRSLGLAPLPVGRVANLSGSRAGLRCAAALSPGRLESSCPRLFLRAAPALAARLLHSGALVVGRPRQHVDPRRSADLAFDRTALGRPALGLLPQLCAVLGRALDVATTPHAGLGRA